MKLPISARLAACAALVPPDAIVADVGCDHGYLGIDLLLRGAAKKVYACDLREGPLAQARRNGERFGVSDRMEFRCCDGLTGLEPGAADAVVLAGMGADTILHILEQSPWALSPSVTRILQPQSSVPELRKALAERALPIVHERLVQEGRFLYAVMIAGIGPAEEPSPAECYCSRELRRSGDPLLPKYLDRQITGLRAAVSGLERGREPERLAFLREALAGLQEMRESL